MRLTADSVVAERGGRRVLADVSFALAAGDLLAVTGPNGAGKSTLLRLVAGLIKPAAGRIVLDPEPEASRGSACHYLGHLDALKRSLTVAENLAFWRHLWGGAGDIAEALAAVGLDGLDHLPAGVLSAGQRRRAAIARLLVAERPVWLLDEPTTALDAAAEVMLGHLIARQRAAGGIVIAATHRALPTPPSATLSLGRAA